MSKIVQSVKNALKARVYKVHYLQSWTITEKDGP